MQKAYPPAAAFDKAEGRQPGEREFANRPMPVRPGRLYIVLVAGILAAAVAIRFFDPFFIQALRLIAFDTYQRLAPAAYDENLPVRIVDIDEESLARIGQWPWSRTVLAELVHRLAEREAAAVAFDILFAEPDRTSPEELAKRLPPEQAAVLAPTLAGKPTTTQAFAAALKETPSVLAVSADRRADAAAGGQGGLRRRRRRSAAVPAVFRRDGAQPADARRGSGRASARSTGCRTATRWCGASPIFYRVGDQFVPTLFTEALRVAQGASHLHPQGVERERRDGLRRSRPASTTSASATSRSRPTPTAASG